MEPFEIPVLGEEQKSNEHLIVAFQRFQIRWGKIENEHGQIVGLLGEFFLPYLPWLKFRLPLSLGQASIINQDIEALLEEATKIDESDESSA